MNLPESFIACETQRTVAHFNANAERCKKHDEKPVLKWDGCWMIDCPKGCMMSDGSNAKPNSIIRQWMQWRGPVQTDLLPKTKW